MSVVSPSHASMKLGKIILGKRVYTKRKHKHVLDNAYLKAGSVSFKLPTVVNL